VRCRRETSFAGGEGQGTFSDGFGRVEQSFADVLSFEIGVECKNLLGSLPFGDQADNGRNRNSKTTQAWNAPHLARVERYSLEFHMRLL
jgi:hypothetical protein